MTATDTALVDRARPVVASLVRGDHGELSPAAAALVLMAKLARVGWCFSLTDTGQFHAVIGDPLDTLSVDQALRVLGGMAADCQAVLAAVQAGCNPHHDS